MGDPEREVYIPRGGQSKYETTTRISASYDDFGDIELYEASE